MFSTGLEVNLNERLKRESEARHIAYLLECTKNEAWLLESIDKLDLTALNTPFKIHLQTGPCIPTSTSLLNFVHASLRVNKNLQAQYPNLEKHLIQRGAKKDILYQWATEEADNKPHPYYRGMMVMDYGTALREYMQWYTQQVANGGFSTAQRAPHINRMKQLINCMSKNDINTQFTHARNVALPLLHYAAHLGIPALVTHLLRRGAHIDNYPGFNGTSALLYCLSTVKARQFKTPMANINACAKVLIGAGADITRPYHTVTTPYCCGLFSLKDTKTILDICRFTDNDPMAIFLLRDCQLDPGHVSYKNDWYVAQVMEANNIDDHRVFSIC